MDIESIFSTKLGRKYARQVKEQKQFTFVGVLLPLLQSLMTRIFPKLTDIFSDVKLRERMKESIENAEDIDDNEKALISMFPEFIEMSLKQESDSMGQNQIPWGEKAVERYLGGMVLAIHSYTEAYIDSVIMELIQNDDLRPKLLRYCDNIRRRYHPSLLDLDEGAEDKNEVLFELVKSTLPWNLVKKMKGIVKALNQLGEYDGYLSKTGEGKIVDEFRYFCEKRNRIAHQEPAPDLEDYGLSLETLDWDELKEQLSDELANSWSEAPASLFTMIEIGIEWGRESSAAEYFTLLERLYKMAILLPAVFDYYISRNSNNPESVGMDFMA